MLTGPLKLFYSYAHEDARARAELHEHLDLLERQRVLVTWHDEKITPGREWLEAIRANLDAADIVLFLVSRAFLNSEFIREVEIPLAMERHHANECRVVPILLEDVGPLDELPFSMLEVLPKKAKPLSAFRDRSQALAGVARGIREAAAEVVWGRGGPFESGPHEFSEAELAPMAPAARARARGGLGRLFRQLSESIPPRKVDRSKLRRSTNLLVATWSLRQFGRKRALTPESHYFIAQIISAFDIVALQEIDHDLSRLETVLSILGPEWGYTISDVSEGKQSNQERVAILYYRPRVESRNIAGEVVLTDDELIEGGQLARKPLIASFATGALEFRLCTAHLLWGRREDDRLGEVEALAGHLARKAKRQTLNMMIAGDLGRADADWHGFEPWRRAGFTVDRRHLHPSFVRGDRVLDFIGLRFDHDPIEQPGRPMKSGALNYYESVYRAEDEHHYRALMHRQQNRGARLRTYELLRTFEMSDHLPVWLELDLRRLVHR